MYLKIWCLIYYMYIVLHLLNHNVDIVIQRNYLNITETIKEYSRYFRTFILVL